MANHSSSSIGGHSIGGGVIGIGVGGMGGIGIGGAGAGVGGGSGGEGVRDGFSFAVDDNFSSTLNDSSFESVIKKYQDSLYIYNQLQNYVLICTYIPLFLIALTSNILVILVVSRYRCLRSVTNYFLVNLSIADLLVTLLCMPMAVGKAIHSIWLYGDLLCKVTHYMQGVAVSSSVFTITAMSIDRYLAIRHPMSRKIINRRTTRTVILVLWTVALLIFAPILFIRRSDGIRFKVQDHTHEYLYCVEDWPDNLSRRTFGIFCFIIVYAIPGCIVVIAYSLMGLRLCSRQLLPEYQLTHGTSNPSSRNDLAHCDSANSAWQVSSAGGRLIRERRRVAKILLVLAMVFAICWFPYSVLSLILDLKSHSQDDQMKAQKKGAESSYDSDSEVASMATLLLPFAILLGHVNSAVNPLLYCLLSKNFRRSVTELIRHPTRAVRGRQHCKFVMTFRRDPPPSGDAISSNNKPEAVNRQPLNHYASEQPKPNSGQFMDEDAAEICIVDLGNNNPSAAAAMVAYSPSSSGYSSLRQSTDTLAIAIVNKENGHAFTHSNPHQYYSSSGAFCLNGLSSGGSAKCSFSNGGCGANHISHQTTTSQAVVAILSKRCAADGRKVHVPSTIREESDSCHSQKSRSNASLRAYVPV